MYFIVSGVININHNSILFLGVQMGLLVSLCVIINYCTNRYSYAKQIKTT